MNYFKKTKFRETSLIFVAVFLVIIYFTISDSSEENDLDVQALIDAAVEEAVEEALSTSSEESTTTTTTSTTTTIPESVGDSTNYETPNFCSSLLDKYNQEDYSTVAIEKPYSGQMVRDTITVQGCSSTFETTVNWQLIGSASSPNRMPDDVRFGEVVASGNTSGGFGEMKLFSFNIPTDQIKDGKYYLRVYQTDESAGESRFKMSETYIPIVINNSFMDISTEFGCSNLIDTYNAIRSSANSSDLYVESIESPFPGEIISETFEVVACGTSQEGGMMFELLDKYGNVVERMTDYAYTGMEVMSFELDTKLYENGRYFIQFSEPYGDACCGGDDIWSRTVIPVFIDNPKPPNVGVPDIKEITFKDSLVLNWYDESAPLYYKRTDEEIEQLNEYHSQEGNERILSITDTAGNKILNNVKIFFGTKSDVLNKGVGHYITTADPSMYKGNVSIAGYSKDEAYTPFENLHTVSEGSKIRWTNVQSGTY